MQHCWADLIRNDAMVDYSIRSALSAHGTKGIPGERAPHQGAANYNQADLSEYSQTVKQSAQVSANPQTIAVFLLLFYFIWLYLHDVLHAHIL